MARPTMAAAPPALHGACVQLCDPNVREVRVAAHAVAQWLQAAPPAEVAAGFDCVLAPIVTRLGEHGLPVGLQEELLGALTPLLERAEPSSLQPEARMRRVFPVVVERLLNLLEGLATSGGVASQLAASREDTASASLRCAGVALRRWYRCCDRTAEIVRMQLGFLAHLSLHFLASGHRELCCQCALVLQAIAETEEDADTLACFFPGVCTAIVKFLLQGDFKLGSKAEAAACDAWRAWIVRVLADAANPACAAVEGVLTLAGLFEGYNSQVRDGKTSKPVLASPAAAKSKSTTSSKLPQLERDGTWLAETGARTAEALVGVLRPSNGKLSITSTDKAGVRRALLRLAIAVLEHCQGTLVGPAVDCCFDAVVGGLADTAETNQGLVRVFLRDRLCGQVPDFRLRERLAERLGVLLQAVLPRPGAALDAAGALEQRLARADGLLLFLRDLVPGACNADSGDKPVAALPSHCAEVLLRPIFGICGIQSRILEGTLSDERPLASLPISRAGRADRFIELFPYDYNDGASVIPQVGASGTADSSSSGDAHQLRAWLASSLYLADGDKAVAASIVRTVGHMASVFEPVSLFALVFDDVGCQWEFQAESDAASEPFPLARASSRCAAAKPSAHVVVDGGAGDSFVAAAWRRGAAMFALSVWLEASCAEGLLLPQWVPRHCVGLALACLRTSRPRAGPGHRDLAARTLHGACALHLLYAALSACTRSGSEPSKASGVHSQVKYVLMPLLAELGSTSLVRSTGARGVLMRLYDLLLQEGSCAVDVDCCDPVQSLISAYADYLVGDICFRLKFDPESNSASGLRSLPAVLAAVVHHVGLEMVPFLSDIVHALLHLEASEADWVLRVLTGTVQQIARLICDRRSAALAARGLKDDENAGGQDGLPQGGARVSSFIAFLTGADCAWKSQRRHNGFLLSDLGACFDEDPRPPDDAEDALRSSRKPPLYGRERRIASSVALWARSYLQAASAAHRHMAHLAVVHSFTILSTRARDLLPRVHEVWPAVVPSFAENAPLAVRADACVVLKHTARLSGDFIRKRFAVDCWPGLWCLLRDAVPVAEAAAAAWSPALKVQLGALGALACLAGDAAIVSSLSENLAALGLKFLPAGRVAGRLRERAQALLRAVVISEPDLIWLCWHALEQSGPPAPDQDDERASDLGQGKLTLETLFRSAPLLAEVGVRPQDFSAEDRVFLSEILEEQDSKQRPRVSLAVGGTLWASFLQPLAGDEASAEGAVANGVSAAMEESDDP